MKFLRNPDKIHRLMTAAQRYGLAVSALKALAKNRDGQFCDPAAASATVKAWARLLAHYTDEEVFAGMEALAGDGVEYLDPNKLAGRCRLMRQGDQGAAKAADVRRARECPHQLCSGDGALQLRLPRPPPRQGARSPGLLWVAALCSCDLAPAIWRDGAKPTGEGAHLFRGEATIRGLRDARETLKAWAEGPALLDHFACVETLSDDVRLGVAAARAMVWELRRDHRKVTEKGGDPERLAAIEDEIATLERLAEARISPRLAGLRTLEVQLDRAAALGATVPAWVASELRGIREPAAAQVAK